MQISISNSIKGLVGVNAIIKMVKNFKARVLADGGTFEAEPCLIDTLKDLKSINLLSQASLIITPNAVEEGKLFSIVPSDGAGDMNVVRATTATRVNAEGLIEEVPYNLFQRSEEFNNAYWNKTAGSTPVITPNSVIAPDGTLTADTITPNNTTTNHWIGKTGFTLVSGTTYAFSVFAKNNGFNLVLSVGSNTIYTNCNFNLSNGTVSTPFATAGANICNPVITNAGNGWYRCTINFTAFMPINALLYSLNNTNTTPTGSFGMASLLGNNISGFYAWGAQLVQGTEPKEYLRTETRLNIPRLDYTNGSCPSILVEPQRTNLLTNSDGNLNTYTTNSNVSDAVLPINGFSNSIQFGDNSLSRLAYKRNFTPTIGVQYTLSLFVQMDDNSIPSLGLTNSTGDFVLILGGLIATLNVNLQRIGVTNVYRVSATYTALNTNTQFGVTKFNTQSAKGFKITAIQLEAGSNATSYIPTVASAVTRTADLISKTGIADFIGQTEGTLFVECKGLINGGSFRQLSISDNSNNNNVFIEFNNAPNLIAAGFIINGVTSFNTNNTTNQVNFNKLIVVYKNSSFKLFINGVFRFELTNFPSITTNLFNTLKFSRGDNNRNFESIVNQLQLYKTALTDQECINLTTL